MRICVTAQTQEDRVAIYLRHVKLSVQIKAGEPGAGVRRAVA